MDITNSQLDKAVKAKIITALQARELKEFLKDDSANHNVSNALYYLGGFIAIAAMTIFMGLQWRSLSYGVILTILSGYFILGLGMANVLAKKNLHAPASICVTFSLCVVPLFVYVLQDLFGFWPDYNLTAPSFYMVDYYIDTKLINLATLLVGFILLYFYRYSFLILTLAIVLWFLAIDIVLGFTKDNDIISLFTMFFGLIMLLVAFFITYKSDPAEDYAFWLYIIGTICFWFGLTYYFFHGVWLKLVFLFVNIILMLLGAVVSKKVFIIFGAIGIFMYFSYLAFEVFADSLLFPFVLVILGAIMMYLGFLWQKHGQKLVKYWR